MLSDSLPECYARFANDAMSVILSAHVFNIYFQVKFSHAGNNDLPSGSDSKHARNLWIQSLSV